jgi:hypothetical protein
MPLIVCKPTRAAHQVRPPLLHQRPNSGVQNTEPQRRTWRGLLGTAPTIVILVSIMQLLTDTCSRTSPALLLNSSAALHNSAALCHSNSSRLPPTAPAALQQAAGKAPLRHTPLIPNCHNKQSRTSATAGRESEREQSSERLDGRRQHCAYIAQRQRQGASSAANTNCRFSLEPSWHLISAWRARP